MDNPRGWFDSAVDHGIVDLNFNGLYTISHSGEDWGNSKAYVVGDHVWSFNHIYTCILNHTSNLSNDQPDTGTNWATYWARKPLEIHVRSNVLTKTQIETLTERTVDGIMPEIGIL